MWVALDLDNKVIAKGFTPHEIVDSIGLPPKDYILMFVGEKDISWIF